MKKTTMPFQGKFPVTQLFGVKVSYMRTGIHNGIDWGMPKGTPLIACFDGTIIECEPWNLLGYGRNFKIQADDGRTLAHYAHCSEIFVNNGNQVKRGDMLAKSGNTGFVISLGGGGYHLHFGIMYDKKWIDPLSVLEGCNLGLKIEESQSAPKKIEVKEDVEQPKVEYIIHTVERGETLSKIAKQYYKNGNLWRKIFDFNKDTIKDYNKIKTGMKIKIPQE